MRIMIVAVMMLLCAATAVVAAERGKPGDTLFCSERCDANYETCMRWRTGKGTVDCPGNFVRCRDECEPPAARAAARAARPPLSCRDACQADFDGCMHRDNGKHSDTCAKNVMICRNGCPAEQPAPVAATAPSGTGTGAATTAPAGEVATPKAPPPAGVGPAADKVRSTAPAVVAPGAPVAARAAAAPQANEARPATSVAAAAENAPSSAVARPVTTPPTSQRPSAWSRFWCGLTGSCDASTAKAPLSCEDACRETYDTCVAHADPKRGGDCGAASVRCQSDCAERKADHERSTP